MNDLTDIDKYKFASVKDAYKYMTPYSYMAKVDISGAYRAVGFNSKFWRFHVWKWNGETLMDTRLMFGHAAGPGEFTELSDAIVLNKVYGVPWNYRVH